MSRCVSQMKIGGQQTILSVQSLGKPNRASKLGEVMEKGSGNEEESRKPEKKRCKTRGGKKIKGTVCFICHIVRCIAEFKLRINENSTVGGGRRFREGFRLSSFFQRFELQSI